MKNYASGERNNQAKLTKDDVYLIRESYAAREKRIAEIDAEIESLQLERMRLRDRLNYRQLAFKFDVSVNTIARVIRLECWD